MQKNCTEFVAYEDILGVTGRGRHAGGRMRAVTDIAAAMPLVRRAIKLLADREVIPQLGLLKSTLLQLDSEFSERAYGASTFRDFVEKLAKAGHVAMKGTDRSFHVELRETGDTAAPTPGAAAAAGTEPAEPHGHRKPQEAREGRARGHGRGPRPGHLSDAGAPNLALPPGDTAAPTPPAADTPPGDGVVRLGPADGLSHHDSGALAHRCEPTFPDVRAAIQTLHEDVRRELR